MHGLVSLQKEVVDIFFNKGNIACVSPDGKPTESGTKMLRALKSGLEASEEIAEGAGLLLFCVRSGLRGLTQAGLANQKDDKY